MKPSISIHEAAKRGKIEAVKQHLDAGTDVNTNDEDGETPLYRAAYHGYNFLLARENLTDHLPIEHRNNKIRQKLLILELIQNFFLEKNTV